MKVTRTVLQWITILAFLGMYGCFTAAKPVAKSKPLKVKPASVMHEYRRLRLAQRLCAKNDGFEVGCYTEKTFCCKNGATFEK